ncbi:ABC transporter ATP-binding protein [Flexivirga sp. B27]
MTTEGLRLDAVSARIGHTQVLHELSLSAPTGKLTALVGANGAGKSTVLRLLVGALRPDTGRLAFDGADLDRLGRRERARQIALLEQQTSTDQDLTAIDVVTLGRIPHLQPWSGLGPADREVAASMLDRVGAPHLADRPYNALSGGEQQRVRLAAALAQQPRLLLVDEPTNHLDIGAQLDALALLRDLADSGLTVVTALHDLGHALGHADHVIAMERGQAVAQGPPAEVLTPTLIHRLYGVHAEVLTHPVTGKSVLAFSRLPSDREMTQLVETREG